MTENSPTGTLVKQAEGLLSGAFKPIRAHGIRAACWLARSALEEAVRELLKARAWEPGSASMRSALTCLEIAYGDKPAVAPKAQYAWSRLSSACHHHAFELSPTAAECRHLVGVVRQLNDFLLEQSGSDTGPKQHHIWGKPCE